MLTRQKETGREIMVVAEGAVWFSFREHSATGIQLRPRFIKK